MKILIGFAVLLGFILIIRWLGAWMLRIDTVINLQKETIKVLKENQGISNLREVRKPSSSTVADKARLYDEMVEKDEKKK
jgi:hypothetical protein